MPLTLGTAEEIEAVVSRWKEKASRHISLRGSHAVESELAYRQVGEELRGKIWDPAASVLGEAKRVFVVPDGALNLVNLMALPVSKTQYLVEAGPLIHYPSAERDLVPAVGGENPLLLSGLILAGANHRASAGPDEDDGILTAEEIAAMDLSGVEWAVLSACDTGIGEVRAGEGVFGLRRAFRVAGAKTLIMSLWSVGDEPTRHWMKALHEARLLKKLSTAEAVREASLQMLRQHRKNHQSTHPFYWAAFVAAGDWR